MNHVASPTELEKKTPAPSRKPSPHSLSFSPFLTSDPSAGLPCLEDNHMAPFIVSSAFSYIAEYILDAAPLYSGLGFNYTMWS